MTRQPTMRDVAERAGVSPMTVSRTLRGQDSVDGDLRDRVLAAVEELGYRRNDLASKLRNGVPSGLIGLVITHLANPFYAQLATGVEEVAADHGRQLLLGSTGDDTDRERSMIDGLVSRNVEGLVLVPSGDGLDQLRPGDLRGVPLVVATSPGEQPECDSVVVDDFGGAREASRRLFLEGHSRVAFLGLSHATWTGRERLRGFVAGRTECGQARLPELELALAAENTRADAQLWRLMASPDAPTAVFAANNRSTLAACRWVRSSGQPLRIVGFDDIETASLFAMPVSLITYSPAELGRAAAELLISRIDGPGGATQRRTIATELTHYTGR